MGLYYSLKDKFDKFIRFIVERLLDPKIKRNIKILLETYLDIELLFTMIQMK